MSSNSVQLSARERINYLLDSNSFVEIGANISKRNTDFNLQQKDAPSDGVITGYGLINNNPVYVYSQDISVLNGTVGEMHAKKIASLYDMAIKVGAPVIGMIDSKGMRLAEATDALDAFGSIYMKQITASGIIPQICAVFGTCGGSLAISASMNDFTFIAKDNGKLFVSAPNTIDNNYVEKCDTASAEFVADCGMADFIGENDEEVLDKVAQLISFIPANNMDTADLFECEDDLNRVCDSLSTDIKDSEFIIADIADNNDFFEVKKESNREMVTGFIRLDGMTIGVVANRSEIAATEDAPKADLGSVLTVGGCEKATSFIKYCDAFEIPVLSITNVTGFDTAKEAQPRMAASVAKLISAFANANVPKINLVTGEAFTSAYISMNSKHIGADLVFAWDGAQIGAMQAKEAVSIIYHDEIEKADDKQALINEKTELYKFGQNNAMSAAKRGYVDCIIEPAATRKNLIYGFEMLLNKNTDFPYKKHGTI